MWTRTDCAYADCVCHEAKDPRDLSDAGYKKGIEYIPAGPLEFEYDGGKSRANKLKHGIDFAEAQSLWSDPNLVELDACCEQEPRLHVGRVGERLWTAVVTIREDRVRIISVRRARAKEVETYAHQEHRHR